MEILCALTILFVSLSFAWRKDWKDLGWVDAWAFLFILAAFFRLIVGAFPLHAGLIARSTILFSGIVMLFFPPKGRKFSIQKALRNFPIILLVLFVWLRSCFPQFDVDSLLYHLAGIEWLSLRHSLPPLQQVAGASSLWYHWLAFEEFLSISGLGLNLPFMAGLMGGVLKILGMLTLWSFIGRRWPLLGTITIFLVVIDDHFLFSGQSRWVYLNPSLIALSTLGIWCAWRSFRGSPTHFWAAIAVGLAISSIKYHGLYFVIGICGILGAGIIRKPRIICSSRAQFGKMFPVIFASACLFVSVYGVHTWESGTPLAPFSVGPLHYLNEFRGSEFLLAAISHGSWITALRHPLQLMIFPGNLAMKAASVLVIPTILLWLFRKKLGLKSRWLGLAILCLVATLLWAIFCDHLRTNESRYPRYVFFTTILGLTSLAAALRRPLLRACKRWVGNQTISFLKNSEFAVSLGLCLWIFTTVDSRYFNVTTNIRPSWGDIYHFLNDRSEDPTGLRHIEKLGMPLLSEILAVQACLNSQNKNGLNLLTGKGLIIYGPNMAWPSLLAGPSAIQGATPEGGGRLILPNGPKDLQILGIKMALIPRNLTTPDGGGLQIRNKSNGKLEDIQFDPNPICLTREMMLVKLR